MSRLQQVIPRCLISIIVMAALLLPQCDADVGTAGHYDPPYTPTACFGYDPLQFPSSFLFAAAGEGIWDNGAGLREAILGPVHKRRPAEDLQSGPIGPGQDCGPGRQRGLPVLVGPCHHRPVKTAFEAIANPSASSVNVKFVQVCSDQDDTGKQSKAKDVEIGNRTTQQKLVKCGKAGPLIDDHSKVAKDSEVLPLVPQLLP
ncbi:hypothetical protein NL676_035347 [Syzygium grande]|nr:hypothetical protein NL676_035347 [Syzygium grande]